MGTVSDRTPDPEGGCPLPPVDEQMCFALYTAARAVTNVYRPHLDPLGLTYPQYLVMMLLWEREECSVKEIGAVLQLDYGTLTPMLKRLETQGLLRRDRDPEDERTVRVTATDEGRRLRARAEGIPDAIGRAIDLPGDEFEATRRSLGRLRANVLGHGADVARRRRT
ncbi:MarR family transcriptional regulator [Nocardiopsis sp. CNR-923]|uniref:MarR family winged helix-turn-helix transcriptional regulator n=1 Tax=Nocardiopsis sp. CNR-923 TaxID=1904965 RepID=UPI0009636F0C|nr:MarR family transcriptional regulator [Nocardiopsis sp. CNR-923]OLT27707.1 MarR family transcriptional regulator [Nocardiopsis sp. CNR-923]